MRLGPHYKEQDEMLQMLRKGGGRQGKGGGDYRAQATMAYDKGGGQYNGNTKGYKGGKGSYSKGAQLPQYPYSTARSQQVNKIPRTQT